jgi:cell division protein ZapA
VAEKPQQLIQVEIFGQTYSVRGGEDPRYLEELAAYVDKQMREISRAGTAVDTLKIAILAALNIADERFQLQSKVANGDEAARRWAEKIATELASALGE